MATPLVTAFLTVPGAPSKLDCPDGLTTCQRVFRYAFNRFGGVSVPPLRRAWSSNTAADTASPNSSGVNDCNHTVTVHGSSANTHTRARARNYSEVA